MPDYYDLLDEVITNGDRISNLIELTEAHNKAILDLTDSYTYLQNKLKKLGKKK